METSCVSTVSTERTATCCGRVSQRLGRAFSIVPKDATKLNWPVLSIATVAIFASGLHCTLIYSFITQMLRSIGIDEKSLGYYAGMACSAYFIGALIGSNFWGYLCDRAGRRPVILSSLVIGFLASILLGFASRYYWIILARLLLGFTNGTFAASKAVIGDVSDDSNLAVGFCLYAVGWSLSSVFGPMIGGLFSEPARKLPLIFTKETALIFRQYPYLLPTLVVSFINVLAFILCFFKLPETKDFYKVVSKSKTETEGDSEMQDTETQQTQSTILTQTLQTLDDVSALGHPFLISQNILHPKQDSCDSGHFVRIRNVNVEIEADAAVESSPLLQVSAPSLCCILCSKPVIIAVSMYGFYAFISTCVDEVTPVWTATLLEYGGLNFTTTEIGILTGIPAIFTTFFSLYGVPFFIGCLGAKKSYILGMILNMAFIPSLSFVRLVVEDPTQKMENIYYLAPIWVSYKLCGTLGFIALSCICNNSVPKEYLGSLNGFAMSCSFGTRILAPTIGGTIFSWTVTPLADGTMKSFPFDFHFVFFCVVVVVFVSVILGFFVPKSCDSIGVGVQRGRARLKL